MGTVQELYECFWLKEVQCNDEQYGSDAYWLIEYLMAFQKGDFSHKTELVGLFIKSGNRRILRLGMRIFMAVCSHDDFELLMDFFENPDDYDIIYSHKNYFLYYIEENNVNVMEMYDEREDFARTLFGIVTTTQET